jgi:photosystem II stability/assembly factor-like uncharacterized protein
MNLVLGTDDGVAVFEGQNEEWRPRYIRLEGHRLTAVAALGQQIWAGMTDGLWHSADGGDTWSPVYPIFGDSHVRAITVQREAQTLLLVGLEPAAILISRDDGQTWAKTPDVTALRDEHQWSLPYSPAAGCVRAFAVHKERFYAAVEVGGILRSDDAGASWRLLEGDVHADVHDLATQTSDPDLLHVATGGGRFRTDDGGKNWKLIGDGYTRAVWADPDQMGTLLTGPARYVGAMGRVERSVDNGDSWTLASDGFRIPMSDMIERFVGAESHVLAIGSDGDLYTAKRGLWIWHALDFGLPPIRAAAVTGA